MKRHQLIVRSRAERDLAAAMAAIQRAPEACRKSHGEYRHLVMRRFPFGVFYLFDGETIAVAAVLPLRQDPASIRDALT